MAALLGLTNLTVDDVCAWLASRGTSEKDIEIIRGIMIVEQSELVKEIRTCCFVN